MEFIDNIKQFILNLNPHYVSLAVLVVMVIVSSIFLFLLNDLIKTGQLKEKYTSIIDKNKESIRRNMKGSKIKAFNYDELELYISRSGLGFMTKEKMTPITYMITKIFFSIFGLFVGLQLSLVYGLIFMLVGYIGLDFIINESNKGDNRLMLEDIKNVYDTLRIQTKAGVYITNVLTECYLVVQNKRLKQALLKLTSDIIAKNDIETSLDSFRNKFSNEYIDTMTIIIKQSLQTGQAAKMFEDIRNQITDIEAAIVMNEKQKIARKIVTVQVMLYIAIILISVYIAMISLSTGLDF